MQEVICPYCNEKAEYIDSDYIYNKSYGMIYMCIPCDAYVGVHKGTDIPLGRLADMELRTYKNKAHHWFDQIAKTSFINKIWRQYIPDTSNRNKAYLWLSKQMDIPLAECHVGMFDIERCQKAIDICKVAINKNKEVLV